MAFTTLSTEDRGAVRIICVDRPDKLNALNRQTLAELHIAFDQAAGDDAVRVVVLRGAGNRAFVAAPTSVNWQASARCRRATSRASASA